MLALLMSRQENVYIQYEVVRGSATCWYLRAAFHCQLCNPGALC